MDFNNSADDDQFRQEVRAALDEMWPKEKRGVHLDTVTPEDRVAFRKAAAERGWLSLGWPEEYGGRPITPMQKYIVSSEASRAGAPLSLYVVNIMGPLIIKYGSEWMKDEILPRIRNGDCDFVLGFTEPETGSDLANLQTRAVREGDEYVINGSKMYGNPKPGDIMYLACRTNPDVPVRNGISVILVEHGTEGMTVGQMPTLGMGSVGSTFYDNVRVPVDHLLGEENKGWDYIREALDLDRTSGIPYGHLPLLMDELLDLVKHTTILGKPLKHDPWVRDRLAQLTIELEAGELLQGMTASKIAAGLKLRSESSVVKIFMTELERRLGEYGVELGGPLAPLTEHDPLALAQGQITGTWLGNPGITIAGGSNEIQRNIIALQGLGLPRD
jgi:alkylation response protein AidB-like acyl-CoA dehydrogenase